MDLKNLEAFCKVYELRSFSKAGQELYLSQPTISAHVSSLENELGVLLFDRLGRGILPTRAGEALYRHAKDIFERLARAKSEVHLLTHKISGTLVLGASTIPAHYILPGVIAGFRARFPDVSLDLRIGDTSEIIRQVRAGVLDAGMVGAMEPEPDLEFACILEDELVVVASSGFNVSRDPLDAEALKALPWIVREKGSGTRKAMENGLSSIGLEFRQLDVAAVVATTHASIQCVRAGLGVCITSRLAVNSFLENGELAALNVPSMTMQRFFYAVNHRRRHMLPASREFLEHLKNKPV